MFKVLHWVLGVVLIMMSSIAVAHHKEIIESRPYVKPKIYGQEYHRYIERRFEIAGLSEFKGLGTGMVKIESRTGREMVSPTGCEGWFQFCKDTAEHYGLIDPYNLSESTTAVIELCGDNIMHLRTYNVTVNRFNIYAAHMIGPYHVWLAYALVDGRNVADQNLARFTEVLAHQWSTKMGDMPTDHREMARIYLNYYNDLFDKMADET